MKIKPMVRSNICLNAHPIGCKKAVEDQIEYTKIRRREREEKNPETKGTIIIGDSRSTNIADKLQSYGVNKVQFVIYHPPYWDIIKFRDNEKDLSNCATIDDFNQSFGEVIDNTSQYLEKNRYCACVIGDKYANSQIVPLGFICMNLFLERGFILKAIIVKNIGDTEGKANQQVIWRYRAMSADYYVFKHEYIMVFKKEVKNKKRKWILIGESLAIG